MPELRCRGRRWTVAAGENLLDALNAAGLAVPYSCRAGHCHACLVRCVDGAPEDLQPAALDPARQAQGWRLACQSRVRGDLGIELFDPALDGLAATVQACDWLPGEVARLRLQPERPLRYAAGQHLLLWLEGIARPYSLASLPQVDDALEFHIDCRRPGAFADALRRLPIGGSLRLGELHGGALHYAAEWGDAPLLLLAGGTGLAPLWAVLREALRQGHAAPVRLWACSRGPHYFAAPLQELAARHPTLEVSLLDPQQWPERLAALRLASRREIALVCGAPPFVEAARRRLFLAGLPAGQVFYERFVGRGDPAE
ncbi:iron-sulfur-binding ferredoxin reductase [Pseudomonas oligotrophica]|uniref:iron-sulfur-binding ferredoxin reductase n=1 Tax=Pseudomonas oligotrophica TaxID=2912055 RepID=UPI001F027D8F|nr:iron-sulfur-binding ferredoxin reductase [Pseudomonas oligotrophica]MCF7203848.1 iron-sulfur-binding ferredoxin reductase [Pseudomonas oligotrophica]